MELYEHLLSAAGGSEPEPSLEAAVEARLERYVHDLGGLVPRDLYALIMPQIERPLLRIALSLAGGRQAQAAQMLGIHRNTLRVRIRDLL